jgi:hypothetical protein
LSVHVVLLRDLRSEEVTLPAKVNHVDQHVVYAGSRNPRRHRFEQKVQISFELVKLKMSTGVQVGLNL